MRLTKFQKDIRKLTREGQHILLKSWLKNWGNFTDKEVETYPYSMVDVMAIMQEYAKEQLKRRPPRTTGIKDE